MQLIQYSYFTHINRKNVYFCCKMGQCINIWMKYAYRYAIKLPAPFVTFYIIIITLCIIIIIIATCILCCCVSETGGYINHMPGVTRNMIQTSFLKLVPLGERRGVSYGHVAFPFQ